MNRNHHSDTQSATTVLVPHTAGGPPGSTRRAAADIRPAAAAARVGSPRRHMTTWRERLILLTAISGRKWQSALTARCDERGHRVVTWRCRQ